MTFAFLAERWVRAAETLSPLRRSHLMGYQRVTAVTAKKAAFQKGRLLSSETFQSQRKATTFNEFLLGLTMTEEWAAGPDQHPSTSERGTSSATGDCSSLLDTGALMFRRKSPENLPEAQIDLELDIGAVIDPTSEEVHRIVFQRTPFARRMSFEQAMSKSCYAICIRMLALIAVKRASKSGVCRMVSPPARHTDDVPAHELAEWVRVPNDQQSRVG